MNNVKVRREIAFLSTGLQALDSKYAGPLFPVACWQSFGVAFSYAEITLTWLA